MLNKVIAACTILLFLQLNTWAYPECPTDGEEPVVIAVKIKVTDSDKLNLPGASVQILPGNFSGTTNQNGELVLAKIPEGKYTLKITYIGYQDVEKQININSATHSFSEILIAGKYKTNQEVIVMGDRLKGQAKALNQQKNSDNITNIVSADQIGRFPDANIGDAIKRIPGITMQNDQGEARNIIVRGMGPEFNAVTFNGERIPSAEGDNRRVQMDLIPSDMIQTVEVNKTLTADMDADAIGGSVNLVTRSAPNGLRISGTLAGGYNPIRKGFNGTAGWVIGTRFAKNKLGFVLSGSYNNNDFGSDNLESVWSKDANGKIFVSDHDIRVYDVQRIRRSMAGNFDYKINAFNTLTLTTSYNWRDDKENRFRLRHRYRGDEDDYAKDLVYDAGGNISGYKNGEVLRQTKGGINEGRNDSRRLEDQRVRAIALKGEHVLGSLKADWSVQYAKASEKRPHERYISMGRRSIEITQDIIDGRLPLLNDNTALTAYTRLNELTEQFQDQYEEDLNAKLNFELPVSLIKKQGGKLKFGLRTRSKTKVRNNNFFEYSPETTIANISVLPLINKTNTGFYPGNKFVAGDFVDAKYLGGIDLKNSSLYEEEDVPAEYLAGNYNASELINAGYVSLNQNFSDKFSANLGIRLEHTSLEYTGNIVEDEDKLAGKATFDNTYLDVLPSINLKYKLTHDFVLKAAWTKSVARPKYYDLVPYFNIMPSDQELSAGNASLEPVRANNFDIMGEKYFQSVGLISAGVFYKTLDKFFYTYIDDRYTADKFSKDFPGINNPIASGETWDFAQRRNGTGASLAGFEVAIQKQLNFLPGIWKGLGIYANYTYTHSKAENIFDADGELVRSNVKLPGAAPHIFNASLSFESKKLVVRVSGNFTSAYVDDSDDAGYNEDAFFDRYYDKQFFLDANASFAITPKLRLFAEANNLTNQPLRYYQGVKDRTAQLEYYGPKLNMGLKFDLSK